MKKTTYSVTVYWRVNGTVVSAPLTGADAENVANLAREKKDLRFTYSGNDTLVPWESVIMVNIVKTVEETSAPVDEICGGAATPTLEVTFNEEYLTVEINESVNPCAALINPIAYVDGGRITLNGEDVTAAWFDAYDTDPQAGANVVGGTYNDDLGGWIVTVPCDAESVTAEIVYKYGDASETYTVVLEVDDGGLD